MDTVGDNAPAKRVWDSDDTVAILRTLEKLAGAANSALSVERILAEIVSSVTTHTPWSICWAGIFDPIENKVVMDVHSGMPGVPPWQVEEWEIRKTPSYRAVEQGAPLLIPDIELADDFPLVQADGRARGFRGVLVVPLRIDDQPGALWMCTDRPHQFTEAETAFAIVVGALTAVALNAASHIQKERELQAVEHRQLIELEKLHDLAMGQNAQLQRLATVHGTLLKELLRDKGMDAVCSAIASLVNSAVLIVDRFGGVVSFDGMAKDVATRVAGSLTAGRTTGTERLRAFHAQPLRLPEPCLVVPIAVEREHLGDLCVLMDPESNSELDIVEQAGFLVALEMLKEQIRLDAELRLARDFIDAVVASTTDSAAQRNRASLLGIDLAQSHRIVRVRVHSIPPPSTGTLAVLAWRVRLDLAAHGVRVVAVPVDRTDVCVVLPVPTAVDADDALVTSTIRTSVRSALRTNPELKEDSITLGIGATGVGPDGLRASFDEATTAINVADALGRSDDDITLASAGIYPLLLAVPKGQADSFAVRSLGMLAEHDAKHGGDLLRTLEVYLDNLGSAQRTANALHLHVTSVRYRLGRIEAVSGCSLDDAETRLSLQVALRVRKLDR